MGKTNKTVLSAMYQKLIKVLSWVNGFTPDNSFAIKIP